MNYDYVLHSNGINYGIIKGNGKIVFIKSGLGGDHFGYENKYLIIASRLYENHGCSVIVSSNPNDGKSHVLEDGKIIRQYISEDGISSPELFFFGHSNGGIKGLELANANISFSKMILINMPLMINLHKTERYILSIPQTEIIAIYGEHDPSFRYLPFIQGKAANLKIKTVKQADHNFKDMDTEFISLCDLLMS